MRPLWTRATGACGANELEVCLSSIKVFGSLYRLILLSGYET